MNKRRIVEKMACDAALTRTQAARALESFMEGVQDSLARGERVTLVGFGSFVLSRRKARRVREPHNGITMELEARSVARFRAGIELKTAIEKADSSD